ncbi:expressed unknown protein [Seminavis robusta]|uniref:MYND-type domain-containing protein n=1 Tax=Seminavis robusta TaxID=568900 RepID=A0A9N8H7G1_9STRA|nr:expressed unknown protein [Seminavis robusta]|eukprot:Sro203_g085570.1 n/a (294) ;mRNA; r:42947-43828
MSATEDLLLVAPHLHLFNEVHTEYVRRRTKHCHEDMDCEELYTLLFRDIRRHASVYVHVLFQMNDLYAEKCSVILCILAHILRIKGKNEPCRQVLDLLDGTVLKVYQQRALLSSKLRRYSNNHRRRPTKQIQRCKALTYKVNDVRIDIHSQPGGVQTTALEALREACHYELEQQFAFEQQKWLVVLFSIVGPSYEQLTNLDIQSVHDETLWQALLQHNRPSSAYHVELGKCHGCDRLESTRGEFEECSNCLKVAYCSYECQLQDWKKSHKKQCCRHTDHFVQRKRPLSFVPWI